MTYKPKYPYDPDWRQHSATSTYDYRMTMLDHEYMCEPWGKLAAEFDYRPSELESTARDILKLAAAYFNYTGDQQ